MTKDQKIIRAKVGVLGLAKQLGNVSQACKLMGYSRAAQQAVRLRNAKWNGPRRQPWNTNSPF